MSTFTAGSVPAKVVKPGAAKIVQNVYLGDGATTFKKGDLVCINTSGQVTDANIGAAAAGDIHGMIINDDYASTAATTSQFVTVMLFADDTVLQMQLYAASASDAEPQDVTVGVGYRLKNAAAGIWTIDVAANDGCMVCVEKPYTGAKWFDPDFASGVDSGLAYFGFMAATLDGHAA